MKFSSPLRITPSAYHRKKREYPNKSTRNHSNVAAITKDTITPMKYRIISFLLNRGV
jgi:hypothetical protein